MCESQGKPHWLDKFRLKRKPRPSVNEDEKVLMCARRKAGVHANYPICIHSFNKYLNSYSVPGTVLGMGIPPSQILEGED